MQKHISLSFIIALSLFSSYALCSWKKNLALVSAIPAAFVSYHEAQYHYNHMMVTLAFHESAETISPKPKQVNTQSSFKSLYENNGSFKNAFHKQSADWGIKAAKHYPYALITKTLQKYGLHENRMGIRYGLVHRYNFVCDKKYKRPTAMIKPV